MLLQLSDSGTSVLQDHMCSNQVVSKIFLLQGFHESGLMSWIRLYELKIYLFYILVCFVFLCAFMMKVLKLALQLIQAVLVVGVK